VFHLVYVSRATQKFEERSLIDLLAAARKKNERRNVTGFLTYDGNYFFQLIEGDESAVRQLMKTIEHDSRHESIKIIGEFETEGRAMPVWTMYYAPLNEMDSQIAGSLLTYFTSGQRVEEKEKLWNLILSLRYVSQA